MPGRGGGDGGALLDLLGAWIVGVATLLTAVGSTGMRAGVTLAADRLVAVVLLGELARGRLHDTVAAPQTKHQMQSGRFLDIIA